VRLFFICIALFLFGNIVGQPLADTLSITATFKGYKFHYKNQEIKPNQVFQIMENNDIAYEEFNASREAYFFGNVFAIVGSALIVYPLINSALGNKANYGSAYAGVCFIGISIPIFRSYHKNTVSSIKKYNDDLPKPLKSDKETSVSIGASSTGIGFKILF